MARRRFQEGQLYRRGKSWIGRWREDILLPNGEVRRVRRARAIGTTRDYPTRALAKRQMQLTLASVNDPSYRPGRMATLAEFAERWQKEVLLHGKPSSIRAAKSRLRVHILPILGSLRMDQIGAEVQQSFISRLAGKMSRKTVVNILTTLSSMLNKAREWKYVCEGVNFRSLSLPVGSNRPQPRFFTPGQVQSILVAAPQPWRTLFAIAAMSGCRAGEVLGLQVADLDFERRLIHVRRSVWYGRSQSPKTANSVRTLPMPDPLFRELQGYLKAWQPNPGGYLFTTRNNRPPSSNNVVEHHLWPILDGLGIPRCGLHAFRHTHSSLLVDSGAPVSVAQAQLGHSDPKVTLGVYSHVVEDSQRRAVERVAGILDYIGLQNGGSTELIQ